MLVPHKSNNKKKNQPAAMHHKATKPSATSGSIDASGHTAATEGSYDDDNDCEDKLDCHCHSSNTSVDDNHNQGSSSTRRCVSFLERVRVHKHTVTLGDHPSVSRGLPLALDWECFESTEIDLQDDRAKDNSNNDDDDNDDGDDNNDDNDDYDDVCLLWSNSNKNNNNNNNKGQSSKFKSKPTHQASKKQSRGPRKIPHECRRQLLQDLGYSQGCFRRAAAEVESIQQSRQRAAAESLSLHNNSNINNNRQKHFNVDEYRQMLTHSSSGNRRSSNSNSNNTPNTLRRQQRQQRQQRQASSSPPKHLSSRPNETSKTVQPLRGKFLSYLRRRSSTRKLLALD